MRIPQKCRKVNIIGWGLVAVDARVRFVVGN
jgi:hypothetical protein